MGKVSLRLDAGRQKTANAPFFPPNTIRMIKKRHSSCLSSFKWKTVRNLCDFRQRAFAASRRRYAEGHRRQAPWLMPGFRAGVACRWNSFSNVEDLRSLGISNDCCSCVYGQMVLNHSRIASASTLGERARVESKWNEIVSVPAKFRLIKETFEPANRNLEA